MRLFGLIVLVLGLCGCARTVTLGSWGTPHELRIAIVSDPSSLNPLFVTSQDAVDMGQLYTETLIGLSPKNDMVPLLAQRIPTRRNGDISSDGLTITYHLRHDERFADGRRVTSGDVAFTYRVIMDHRNPVTSIAPYRQIASLETPDPYTVRIRLRKPWAAATSELFAESDYAFGILPAHAFTSTDLSRSSWNEKPFGSGPFRVTAWHHGDEIILEPNPYARRRPHLHRLIFKIVPDANTRFVAIRTHAVDAADLTDKQLGPARRNQGLRVITTLQNHTDFLEFQTQRPPLNNALIRRALIEAIDRHAIARTVYLGYHPLATTEIPQTLWAHDPSVPSPRYDPARSRADLQRADWNPQTSLQFAYIGSSEDSRLLATLVQANLAAVGVRLVLRSYPSTLFYAPAQSGGIERGGRFDMTYTDWFGGADPEQSETYRCADLAPAGPNTTRWCNASYDALYRSQAQATSRAARMRAFSRMQQLVHNAAVADFLVYQSVATALNPRVRGYAPNMLFKFSNSEDWDL
jgi:peptide/nickel transport system substrate-binding protein